MKNTLTTLALLLFALTDICLSQQTSLGNKRGQDRILQIRRETVNAKELIVSLLSGEPWFDSNWSVGIIDKVERLPAVHTNTVELPAGKRVSIRIIGGAASPRHVIDDRGSFSLQEDWRDSANRRSNLVNVDDDPLVIGRTFAIEFDKSESIGHPIKLLRPLPKEWVDGFDSTRAKLNEIDQLLRSKTLSKADVVSLVTLHGSPSEFIRCVAFAKLLDSGAWGAVEVSKAIRNSNSVTEAAVTTAICLDNSGTDSGSVNLLCDIKEFSENALLGIGFGCYTTLNTKYNNLRGDLQTEQALSTFNLPEDAALLAQIKTRMLGLPVIRLFVATSKVPCAPGTSATLHLLIDAANLTVLAK